LTIHKTDADGNPLEGAGFELWKIVTVQNGDEEVEETQYFFGNQYTETNDAGNTITYYKGVFKTKDDESESCILYTDPDGNIYIRYLDEKGCEEDGCEGGGIYHLQEVVAPDGYVLDENVYDVVITACDTAEITVTNVAIPTEVEEPQVPEAETTPEPTTEPTTETGGTIAQTPAFATVTAEPSTEKQTGEGGSAITNEPAYATVDSTTPKTGDDTPLWAVTSLLALFGLLALAAADKKGKPCKH
jgi:hypothetical protein